MGLFNRKSKVYWTSVDFYIKQNIDVDLNIVFFGKDWSEKDHTEFIYNCLKKYESELSQRESYNSAIAHYYKEGGLSNLNEVQSVIFNKHLKGLFPETQNNKLPERKWKVNPIK